MDSESIWEIGEKRLIKELIRPLFNNNQDPHGVGDDCGMVSVGEGPMWLFSTDRVPADLISFRLGILDHRKLGDYLARLNLSDIAACGGTPIGLLLNLALPQGFAYEDLRALCQGFQEAASRHNCVVLGGDLSSSSELSISATSVGIVDKDRVLLRSTAQAGDTIFFSKPLGLTPAAFTVFLDGSDWPLALSPDEIATLRGQFTDTEPMFGLAQALAASGDCTSCMDNTDGVAQSLVELAEASNGAFIVERNRLQLPRLVAKISDAYAVDALALAFGAGADFGLVGTLSGRWTDVEAHRKFGDDLQIIGRTEQGQGLFLETNNSRQPWSVPGWNYFQTPKS